MSFWALCWDLFSALPSGLSGHHSHKHSTTAVHLLRRCHHLDWKYQVDDLFWWFNVQGSCFHSLEIFRLAVNYAWTVIHSFVLQDVFTTIFCWNQSCYQFGVYGFTFITSNTHSLYALCRRIFFWFGSPSLAWLFNFVEYGQNSPSQFFCASKTKDCVFLHSSLAINTRDNIITYYNITSESMSGFLHHLLYFSHVYTRMHPRVIGRA